MFLSTYIFNAGEVADKFIAALTRAMRRGVDVRVLVDGYGTFYSIKKPWKMLASEGGKNRAFQAAHAFSSQSGHQFAQPPQGAGLRWHTGFTGGLNIADGNVSCLAKKEGIKAIHDMHFRFEGPVVSQLRGAFCSTGPFAPIAIRPAAVAGSGGRRLRLPGGC